MKKSLILAISALLIFSQCRNLEPSVNLSESSDPDIVLVNIGNGDRSFIGKILLKLDSLEPVLIGIDVLFQKPKAPHKDSILMDALKRIDNDFLVYTLNKDKSIEKSDPGFAVFVKGQGLLTYERTFDLVSTMTPIQKIGLDIHESFAYKLVKYWKPGLKIPIDINEQIKINYQRFLESFLRVDGSVLLKENIEIFDLKNKIFLVGYIGPGEEDKYFTPLRLVGNELDDDEPDTYGIVIIANQIRTILEYKK